ncbi:CHAT domain-containing protein, partial [Rubrivirga sp.]|uniref:CHAT domain-containing protein n=1 Tax=Rubrivirga sp. TaxID=1885344 RepID=UPI003C7173BB
TAESYVRLLIQRGYVLAELGRTVEGARSYYKAASMSYTVEADVGSRALAEAASTARILGDAAASARYIRATLDLIEDSLITNERLQHPLGLVLTSRAILTMETMESQPSDSLWESEASTLLAHADHALEELPSDGQFIGYRSVAMALRALALQMLDDEEASSSALEIAESEAERAGLLLPVAPYTVSMIESRVCVLREDPECARDAAQRALEISLNRSDLEGEASALEQLGAIAEGERDWERAHRHYEAAVSLQETYRDRLGLQDWSASAFAKVQASFRGLARTQLAMGDVEEALIVLDATRARYLQDVVRHHAIRRSLTDSTRHLIDSLSSRLVDTRVELYRETSPDRQSELMSAVSELQSGLEAVSAPRRSDTRLNVQDLRDRLRARDQTLVSFMIDRSGSTAFVVNGDTVIARPLDVSPATVRTILQRVGFPWNETSMSNPSFSLDALHALYRQLWEPIEDVVATSSVVIVPDAVTSTVPFAALTTETSTEYESAPYLINRITIGYDVSASFVAGPDHVTIRDAEAILMGRATFEGSMWNNLISDLNHVEDELRGVQASIGGTRLLDDEATESEFYRRARQADVIHIASHAEADPTFPLSSRIELASDAYEDGTLHLYEVMETTLQADMVVLSGCSTGGGVAVAGEGIIGLQYGMRAAGARSTVATLWPVSDRASATLMTSFYNAVASGSRKDEALRRAQIEYIESHAGIRASPFFWAAPTVSGDASAIYEPSSQWQSFIFGMLALALIGIAWSLYRTKLHVRLQRPV